SVNHKREEANRKRETEMDNAIKIWEKTDRDEFKRRVENKTNELIQIWENEILAERILLNEQRKNENVTGIICCKKCNHELGEIAWLKRRNTAYFITNENFFKKTTVSATPFTRVQEILFKGTFLQRGNKSFESYKKSSKQVFDISLAGREGDVKCQCGSKLGGFQKYLDRRDLGDMCALACKNVKFRRDNETQYFMIPKWTAVREFYVPFIEEL
ncbi:unnamed protein product, partial [Didymodactylos carnosus]